MQVVVWMQCCFWPVSYGQTGKCNRVHYCRASLSSSGSLSISFSYSWAQHLFAINKYWNKFCLHTVRAHIFWKKCVAWVSGFANIINHWDTWCAGVFKVLLIYLLFSVYYSKIATDIVINLVSISKANRKW